MSPEILGKYKASWCVVPLHELPDADAPMIGAISKGAIIEVIEKERHWIKVKGYEGWAATTMMERITDHPEPDAARSGL